MPIFKDEADYKESFIQDLPQLKEYLDAGFDDRFICAAHLNMVGASFDEDKVPEFDPGKVFASASIVVTKKGAAGQRVSTPVVHVVTEDDLRGLEPERIHNLLESFWQQLPDSFSIRTGWFPKLCDFCSEWKCWEVELETAVVVA